MTEGLVPPADITTEANLLGVLLFDGRQMSALPSRLRPESFYSEAHRQIFSACLDVHADGAEVNTMTVGQRLHDRGRLQQVKGGMAYLGELANSVPIVSQVTLDKLATGVINLATQRAYLIALKRAVARAQGRDLDIGAELDAFEREILGLSLGIESGGLKPFAVALKAEVSEWERRSQSKDLPGIETGFRSLDDVLGRMHGGDLVVVGARPGMGKTSFAMNVAVHVAKGPLFNVAPSDKDPEMFAPAVGIFSLEMPEGQLAGRVLAGEANVGASQIRSGRVSPTDMTAVHKALSDLRDLPIYVDDAKRGRPTVTDIVARVRRVASQLERKRQRLRLIVVDYIQIVKAREELQKQRHDLAIGEISTELKSLAKELDATVIALAQLNRSVESRQNKRPTMADLRDSGQIEQDADSIVFLYRDEVYNPRTDAKGVAEVLVEKNRHGSVDRVFLYFEGRTTSFKDAPQLNNRSSE